MFCAVTFDEVFTLKCHAILHGDPAAEGFNPLDVAVRDRFTVVEEPMQAVERDLAIDFFIYVQGAADRFVISCVQTERPAIFNQMSDDRFDLRLHYGRHIRARLEDVLEVRG